MVRRSQTTTRFGGPPEAFQFAIRRERATGRIIDVREFRGTIRGGIRTVRTGEQIRAQRAEAERQRKISREKVLLEKATKKLLTPQERAELERITAPPIVPTREAPGILRTGGLSPLERVRLVEQRKLEAERTKILLDQRSIDVKFQELQARGEVLQRIINAGIAKPGVVTKFNREVEAAIKEQKSLTSQSQKTERKIASFKKPGVTRVVGVAPIVSKTAAEALPVIREFRERVAKEKRIQPLELPLISEPSAKRIAEFKRIGAEFGARFIGPEPTVFGARVGAVTAFGLGVFEEAARFAADVPLFTFETLTGRPLRIKVREIPPEVKALRKRVELFRKRKPTFPVSFRQAILGAARVPVFGELIGAREAITPEGRVEITRAAAREFGTSAALLLGPEFVVAGARVAARARVPTQTFLAKVLGPKFRPTLRFEVPLPPTRAPTAEELKIAEITRRRLKTVEQIRGEFAAVQKKATQTELERLLGKSKPTVITKPLRPTKEAIDFGKVDFPKVRPAQPVKKPFGGDIVVKKPPKPKVTIRLKRKGLKEEITISFPKIGEKGVLFPGRPPRRPGVQIQIRRPTFLEPIRIPKPTPRRFRVVQLKDILKQFEIPVIKPRVRTGLRLRPALLAGLAARTALSEKELFGTLQKQRTSLREFEKFRQSQLQKQAEFFRVRVKDRVTEATRAKQAQREAERFRLSLIGITVPRQVTITRPKEVLKIKEPKVKEPRRPKVFVPFLPEIEAPEFLMPPAKKVPGFVAFVKEKPFAKKRFRKVSKVLPEEIALQRGFRVADLTIAQSVRLKRAKRKVRSQPKSFTDLSFKFRQKGKTFIEKRRFAIDTPTEKQELGVAKFLAQEKRGFLGVAPRKRKRRRRN